MDSLDEVYIPDAVEVRAPVEEANLRVVATTVAPVADMKGLVQVLHQVKGHPQRELAFRAWTGAVGEDAAEFLELRDHASRLLVAVPRGVSGGIDRDIHIVPWPRTGRRPAMIVGPGRGIGEGLSLFEQFLDGCSCGGGEDFPRCESRCSVTNPSPGLGATRREEAGTEYRKHEDAKAELTTAGSDAGVRRGHSVVLEVSAVRPMG
jgi:hypothetical protein